MEYGRHSSRFVPVQTDPGMNETTTLTILGLQLAFERGIWLKERFGPLLGDIELPLDSDLVYFRSSNTSRTILSMLSQNIGMFGSKRCIEKFDEFLIQSPKTDTYSNLDQLIEATHLYDHCFREYDGLLFISKAGQSLVANAENHDSCPFI